MKFNKKVVILAITLALPRMVHAQYKTLYERLGGREIFTSAANEIVENVSHDPLSSRSFDGVALAPLKAKVADHLCSLSGGPCIYTGENMTVAHTGLAITADEFNIMGEYVHVAFLRRGADEKDLLELEAILERLRPDVLLK